MSITAPPETADPPVEAEEQAPAPTGLIVLDTEDAPACADGNCW